MDIAVDVTDAGLLQVTVDGVTWAPLPAEAVRAMASQLSAAEIAASRQELSEGLRGLAAILASSGADMAASVEVGPDGATATVDDDSYDRAQQKVDAVLDEATGDVSFGQIVIRKRRPDLTA